MRRPAGAGVAEGLAAPSLGPLLPPAGTTAVADGRGGGAAGAARGPDAWSVGGGRGGEALKVPGGAPACSCRRVAKQGCST